MSESPQKAGISAEPTEKELSEILQDLDFFLDMEQVESVPLDDTQNGKGAERD